MKKLLALFSCAAMLLTLASCASPAAPTSSVDAPEQASSEAPSSESASKVSTQGTTISFWYCYTDKVQENNENLTKEFNETAGKDMGITVTAEYQGDYAAMAQKLKAAFVAGTAPAVTVMDTSMLQPFALSSVLQPLDSYIDRDKVDMGDFQPAFLTDSEFNGKTYSLPYLRSTPILYLNTTLLTQAGLDPKGPATWDELATYAKTINEKTGKYGLDFFADTWLFQSLMMAEGSSTYNDDATATNINSDAAKKIITTITDMSDNGSTHLLANSQSSNLIADISNQNCAMWFYSTGGLTTFIGLGQQNQFDVSVTAMPKGIQNACPTGGANLVMTSKLTDTEKESAWQFINWMTQKSQTIQASTTTGYLPSRISAANDPSMQALYQEMPQFKVAIDQLSNAGGRTVSASEADAEIVKALDAIWVNKQDMNTTLSALQTKVDGILNQQ
ncbi:MAG: ABC transporter substrate-binding protein [Acetanaerobacterium sp.]